MPVTSRTLVLGFTAASVVISARFAAAQDGAAATAGASASASVAGSVTVAAPVAPPAPSAAVAASASVAVTATPAPTTSPAPATSAAPTTPAAPTDSSGIVVTSGSPESKKDEGAKAAKPEGEKEKPFNPFAGSSFIIDQSATANSFVKDAQQSYMPLTETWLSARLRYNFDKHWKVGLRQDFFLEETDTQGDTALRHEWRLGDTWLNGIYAHDAKFVNDNPGTGYTLGAVLRPPTSKESQANGYYLGAGLNASFIWAFEPNKGSKWFSEASLNPTVGYTHYFSAATTPVDPSSAAVVRQKQNLSGGLSDSDQVRSGTLGANTLIYALNADLGIYDKLTMSASMIFISTFSYAPPDATLTASGLSYPIPRNPNDQHIRQSGWFLVDFNYDLMDELSLSVGYYNLRPLVGPAGTYVNPTGSPDSRFFFDVVVHLDALYKDATGLGKKKPAAVAKR